MLGSLAAIDNRRRALAACALAWVVVARAALAVSGGSLPKTQRWLDRLAAGLPAPPRFEPREAAWAITAAARRVPGTRCLAWALALRGLLVQAGVESAVRIGVAPAAARRIAAHAWIEAGGEIFSWGDVAGYSVLGPRAART